MKNSHLFSCACALLLISCAAPTPFQRVASGDPIMPVNLGEDSTRIFLTDYVPSLMDNGFDQVLIDNREFAAENGIIDLASSDLSNPASIHVLTFLKGDQHLEVPVLPSIPREQALYTVAADNEHIFVRFVEQPQQVEWAMFWQNQHIAFDAPAAPDAEERWILPFPAEARHAKGRSYIRIYAIGDNQVAGCLELFKALV